MTINNNKKKVLLIIRDGYGERTAKKDNAVKVAKTPYTNKLMKQYPVSLLETSGEAVGLPKGYMGGSEVGHLTIGSGRIIYQNLAKIQKEIQTGKFKQNKTLTSEIRTAKKEGKAIHLIGLLQDKGVHAHQDHLFELIKMCHEAGLSKEHIQIHIISDGRDSPQKSVRDYLKKLEKTIKKYPSTIATITGRYYAMDRDTRWDRTKKAYECIINGKGKTAKTTREAITKSYKLKKWDEFIEPHTIGKYEGAHSGDHFIFYNYRTDRVRQIVKAMIDPAFDEFEKAHKYLKITTMTEYYKGCPANVAYKTDIPKNTLGEVIAKNNLKQLRISETEKYPHVTFFFNGQKEQKNKFEQRVLIPSPREVATYDEKPEMSIFEIKEKLLKEMKKDYSLIVLNYVNGDMVGHTGDMQAAVKAVESIDKALKETVETAKNLGYNILIFADHGNCEEMSGEHQTSHTLNKVDLIYISSNDNEQNQKNKAKKIKIKDGGLKDIAPTALDILGITKPKEMTGKSLLTK